MTDAWAWKPKEGPGPKGAGLRYEPGNWGDVLKGEWALRIVERWGLERGFVDAFAGRPEYPVSAVAAERVRGLPACIYQRAEMPFLRRGTLASTGGLLVERLGEGAEGLVFDLDLDRRAAWEAAAGVRVASGVEDGVELVTQIANEGVDADLVLVDPYDFFDHWGPMVEPLLNLADQAPTLLYHLNKAPRGAGHLDQYERFLRALDAKRPKGMGVLIGRLPSDARLPRAYHEVVLFAPQTVLDECAEELSECTRQLAQRLSDAGAIERRDG